MMNLDGFQPLSLNIEELPLEDRWILSRLATVTEESTVAMKQFKFAEAARLLYDFAWDHFCSYYVEIAKPRLQDAASRPVVQQVLAHTLDHLLRLLHPIIPFVTEAIWQQLSKFGTQRCLRTTVPASRWIMQADWPSSQASDKNATIERQFAKFVSAVSAIREVRSRQNIPPKDTVPFCIVCDDVTRSLLEPMRPFIESLANAKSTGVGTQPVIPSLFAQSNIDQMEIYVDLSGFVDVDAEIARNEKLLENLMKQIQGKENKLSNESFVSRAPADVVQKERESLAELVSQREAADKSLRTLRASRSK